MATGTPGTNGVWQYGEDDSEATFSALLNKAASTTDTQIGLDRARLTALEASGRVLQVKSATKTTAFSSTSSTFVDITDVSVSITPRSTSSKILVTVTFVYSVSNASYNAYFNLVRNTTPIGQSTGGVANQSISPYTNNASNSDVSSIQFLDSPATTSATTYKLQGRIDSGITFHVGRYAAGGSYPCISTITVMEVAG